MHEPRHQPIDHKRREGPPPLLKIRRQLCADGTHRDGVQVVERAHLRNLPLAARACENKHRGQRQQARQHDLPDLRKNVSHKKHSSLR